MGFEIAFWSFTFGFFLGLRLMVHCMARTRSVDEGAEH